MWRRSGADRAPRGRCGGLIVPIRGHRKPPQLSKLPVACADVLVVKRAEIRDCVELANVDTSTEGHPSPTLLWRSTPG